MKKPRLLFIFFISLFFSSTGRSQGWAPQADGVLPDGYWTWALSAVDEQSVWALCYSAEITDPKLIRTVDGGDTWEVRDLSEFQSYGNAMDIHAISADTIWLVWFGVTSNLKRLQLSVDGGNTWSLKRIYASGADVLGPALKFGDRESGYMIDPWNIRCNQTADGGASWSGVVMFSGFESGESWGMASPTNWMDARGDTVWWGTSKNIHRSTDNGETWEAFPHGFGGNYQTNSVAFNEHRKGLAISNAQLRPSVSILNETQVRGSQNGGATWTELPAANISLHSVTHVPGTENTFVGVGGIWKFFAPEEAADQQAGSAYTMNGGQSWIIIDNLPRNAVEFVSPQVGWAGNIPGFDYGGSPLLFKWDGTTLGDEVSTDETSLQTNTFLQPRITPNPFFASIRIDLSAFRHGRYVLRDISGQAIRQASFYGQEFEINGLDRLSSGFYVLELKGEDFSVSRKVVKR